MLQRQVVGKERKAQLRLLDFVLRAFVKGRRCWRLFALQSFYRAIVIGS
jgi:hypothetical protein